MLTQREYLSLFLGKHKNDIIVASLGTISKDLLDFGWKEILVRGAMGCAVGVGLGYALHTDKDVYVLIGDGALLMKLGSLATVKKYGPQNLYIVVLDNGVHASTGGQATSFAYIRRYIEELCDVVSIQP